MCHLDESDEFWIDQIIGLQYQEIKIYQYLSLKVEWALKMFSDTRYAYHVILHIHTCIVTSYTRPWATYTPRSPPPPPPQLNQTQLFLKPRSVLKTIPLVNRKNIGMKYPFRTITQGYPKMALTRVGAGRNLTFIIYPSATCLKQNFIYSCDIPNERVWSQFASELFIIIIWLPICWQNGTF